MFLIPIDLSITKKKLPFLSSPALSRPPSPLAVANVENVDTRHDAMIPPSGASHENAGNVANTDENAEDDGNFNEQTTLLNNEEESFALAPVDASALKGMLNRHSNSPLWFCRSF